MAMMTIEFSTSFPQLLRLFHKFSTIHQNPDNMVNRNRLLEKQVVFKQRIHPEKPVK